MSFIRASFPEEVVDDMSRKDLWNLPIEQTVYKHQYTTEKRDDNGDLVNHVRIQLFKMSPRWLLKQIKKNPLVTKDELKELAA